MKSAYLFPILTFVASTFSMIIGAPSSMLSPGIREVGSSCGVDICFALSGSQSMTREEYEWQVDFVTNVVLSIVKDEVRYSAVQYGSSAQVIAKLSDFTKFEEFLFTVDQSVFGNSRFNNISDGITLCALQLGPEISNLRKKRIVLFRNGKSDSGSDPSLAAKLFETWGGEIWGVERPHSFNSFGGLVSSPKNIFYSHGYHELAKQLDILAHASCI